MRQSIIVFLLLLCALIHRKSDAMANISYLDSTSTWYEEFGATNGITVYKDQNKYYLDGDTLTSGNTYYRLYWDVVDSTFDAFTNTFISVNYFNHVYLGGLREDSLKRFYILFPGHVTESLLFDFNLSTGDSLPDMISNYSCNTPPVTISSVDSTQLGLNRIKIFHLPPSAFNKILYEGIGSSGGFIWTGSLCTAIESGACLVAYKKGQDSVYFNCGSAVTSLSEIPGQNNLTVYPNPASGYIHLQNNYLSSLTFHLYNNIGEELLTDFLPENVHLSTIQIHDFANGMYFWKLLDENKIIQTGKFLIIN